MQLLKGLAVSLLGLLLFLGLSIYGIAFMLNQTLLDPDFIVSELNRLDIPSLAKESVIKQIEPQISQQFPQGREVMKTVINNTIDDLKPWIEEQVSTTVYATYDYFTGKSDSLSLIIPLEPVRDHLENNLRQTILESPPPSLTTVPLPIREQIYLQIEQQIATDFPATFDLNDSLLNPEVRGTVAQVRQAISYFQIAYRGLIGLMLLLILGIFLIKRQVKSTTRSLGITFLTFGVFEYAGLWAAKYFIETGLPLPGLPPSVQEWLPQFSSNLLAPLVTFSIGVAAVGLGLIIISVIYHRPSAIPD